MLTNFFYFIPIELFKFSISLFFLLIISYYDIKEGRIPNKILIFMFIIGVLFLFIEKEYFLEKIITFLSVFLISIFLWNLSLINPGDVKLLPLISLYLPYSTQLNPYKSLFVFLIIVIFIYSIYSIMINIKRIDIKEILYLYTYYLKKSDKQSIFLLSTSIVNIFLLFNLDYLSSLLLVFLFIFLIDYISTFLETNVKILLLFSNILLIFYLIYYKNLQVAYLIYNYIFIFLFFLFIRNLFFILFYLISIKQKKIEELKEGDKLAILPIKIGGKIAVIPLTSIFLTPSFKSRIAFSYDPSIGLEKSNINKIKNFFKKNKIIKVKIFDNIPFLPFLLIAYLLYYFFYFYSFIF